MNQDAVYQGVFLPTDHTKAGVHAFCHGLKLALSARVPLRLLHVKAADAPGSMHAFPQVRETLSRWTGRSISNDDLVEMGLAVRKKIAHGDDPIRAILGGLKKHKEHLAVLAPHHHAGFAELFHQSVSNAVARNSRSLTLFVPEGSRGFVNVQDGSLELDNILFPVDHKPYPQPALDLLESIGEDLGLKKATGHMLHVGAEEKIHCFPSVHPRWLWEWHHHVGDPVETILEKADTLKCRLIAMVTEGRQGFMDKVRGSVTERLIKQAPCPVLVLH